MGCEDGGASNVPGESACRAHALLPLQHLQLAAVPRHLPWAVRCLLRGLQLRAGRAWSRVPCACRLLLLLPEQASPNFTSRILNAVNGAAC